MLCWTRLQGIIALRQGLKDIKELAMSITLAQALRQEDGRYYFVNLVDNDKNRRLYHNDVLVSKRPNVPRNGLMA
ncbi:MAG: hypothetical protein R2865_00575 [Deinococcales bacterium]